jgi:hypothetical protein
MNLHKVSIHLSDAVYAVALKKAGALGVERFLDHLVADLLLQERQQNKSAAITIEAKNVSVSPTDDIFKTILQIHAIVQYVHKDGMNFRKAVKTAAFDFGVNESTIRDKCTRRISSIANKINTEKFEELLKTPEKLFELLCERFPDHRQAILEKFKL